MAQLIENALSIKISKIIRDTDETTGVLFPDDAIETLEQIITELAGSDVLIEIERN